MHHLCAFSASNVQTVEVDTPALTDGIMSIQNNHFFLQRDMPILFAAVASATQSRARLSSPTLRQITTPFIRPISTAASFGVPQRVQDFNTNYPVAKAQEELSLLSVQLGAGAERVTGIVGLGFQMTPPPAGPAYTLRGTSTTAAVANAWSPIAMTWQDTLPAGVYAVVGGEHVSAGGMAFRLILEQAFYRPGGLSIVANGNYSDPIFHNAHLGEWGRFTANAFPNVEVLAVSADAAHDVYLELVKVG